MPYSNCKDFLKECRELIDKRKVDPYTNNPDTKSTLNFLSYSVAAMLQEIKELDEKDLDKGPVPDKSSKHPGNVWIFIKDIQGYSMYIKLKIRIVPGRRELFVMSFHPEKSKKE